jgi:chromosome partitioning protein
MNSMAKVLSVVNHKGGVGKTTTTLNLGKALSILGKRVLIIDMDPQANLSQSVGIEEPEISVYDALSKKIDLPVIPIADNLDLSPADLDLSKAEKELLTDVNSHFKLRNLIVKVAPDYDYILVDCPPSLGILTINALISSDEVIITLQAENLAVKGIKAIQDLIDSVKENLNPKLKICGVLITQIDRTVLKRTISDLIKDTFKEKVFQTSIRSLIAFSEASLAGQDIFTYNPKSHGAEDYMSLAEEVLKR